MDILVSIVMPVYNVEKYICNAVKSVLEQTYSKIELIIVNDGTKDNSIEVIANMVKNDKRIRIINRSNGGLSAARNTGLKECKGKYVLFMDSDDTIENDLIEKTIKVAEQEKSDIVVFGYSVIHCNEDDEMISKSHVSFDNLCYEDIIKENQIPSYFPTAIGYAWNKLYNLSYLKKYNYMFEEGISLIEDVLFNEKVFAGTKKINFVAGSYYKYWSRPRQTLSDTYYKNMFDLFKRGFASRADLLKYLYVNAENLNQVLNDNYMNGIRSCCANLFKYKMENSEKNKLIGLKKILYDSKTVDIALNYEGYNRFSAVLCYCIRNKFTAIIYILYKVRFIIK